MTAYELVAALQNLHHKVAPQQVYRIIRRLESEGQIMRVESIQAYRACDADAEPTGLLVCEGCNRIEIVPALDRAKLQNIGCTAGFKVLRFIVEALGICPNCQEETGRQALAH